MIAQALVISLSFQLTSAVASVGRVKTASHVVSRRFNALALGAVAADFAVRYLYTGRADFLVGLAVFTVLTARTLLILSFSSIEGNTLRRRVACASAFLVCTTASVSAQIFVSGALRPMTLLPLVGIGLGCLGEASNHMVVRRRCILGMGCIMAIFGVSTSAWGLVFKNVASDVGATVYAMIKYRDPPLLIGRDLAVHRDLPLRANTRGYMAINLNHNPVMLASEQRQPIVSGTRVSHRPKSQSSR